MGRLVESQRESFEALRREYLAGVPARIAAIRRAAAEAGRPGAPRAALDDLLHEAHRLTGSSAIFGLPRVSAAARALEDLAIRLLGGSARAAEIDARVAALEATWNECAAPRDRGAGD
jgi:HPt (histidine-containing phosphotransfer) domain-containing protein